MVEIAENDERSLEMFAEDDDDLVLEITMQDERVVLMVEQRGPQGIQGIAGPPGVAGGNAQGAVAVANTVWLMTHGLELTEDRFNPAGFWFEDENGDPMEPEEVVWINPNQAVAQWPDPVRGSWKF